jgi:hypothetical protein
VTPNSQVQLPKNALFSTLHSMNGFEFWLLITATFFFVIQPVYNVLIQTIYFEGVNLVRMNVIYKVVFAKSLSDGSVHR